MTLWLVAALAACLPTGPASAQTVPYEVRLDGIEDAALRATLEQLSQLFGLRDRPPGSVAALQRRAEADVPRLDQALRAAGYYAAEIATEILGDGEADRPVQVVLSVTPGPRYRLAPVVLQTLPDTPSLPGIPPTPEDLGLVAGAPARSADIVAAEGRLLQILDERAHPFARIADRRVVVDHATREMEVTLTVDAGQAARFGTVSFVGLRDMREAAVFGYLPWRPGDPYDPAQIAQLRRDLAASGPFSSVAVAIADAPAADGTVPVVVTVEEMPGNFVGGGLSYATEDGPGIKLFWGDRNLFGNAERLEITARISEPYQGIEASFRRPLFLRREQSLLLRGEAAIQDTEAFYSQGLQLSAKVERRLTPQLAVSAGLDLSLTRITEAGLTEDVTLLSLPLGLTRDTTDDLLDPTRGDRTTLQVTPYVGTSGAFGIVRLRESAYLSLSDSVVLAGWVGAGAILGGDTRDIPAPLRFYAGGGGSVRGYAFQKAGPLDGGGRPLGGRSLIEFGGEVRWRFLEDFGIAPFIEAGNVSDSMLPDPGEELFVGAGIGLRYYSPIGPVRLDVGVPLRRRAGIDDGYQIYVSLGQAF